MAQSVSIALILAYLVVTVSNSCEGLEIVGSSGDIPKLSMLVKLLMSLEGDEELELDLLRPALLLVGRPEDAPITMS